VPVIDAHGLELIEPDADRDVAGEREPERVPDGEGDVEAERDGLVLTLALAVVDRERHVDGEAESVALGERVRVAQPLADWHFDADGEPL